jgi:DnaK suppressor protein
MTSVRDGVNRNSPDREIFEEEVTLQELREFLLSKKSRIEAARSRDQVGLEQEQQLNVLSSSPELVEIAQTMEQLEREKSLVEQEKRELEAIEAALCRFADGTFGICEECEERIQVRRLRVLPQARLCARCQTIEEHRYSRTRSANRGGSSSFITK